MAHLSFNNMDHMRISCTEIVKNLRQYNQEDDRSCACPLYSLVHIFPKELQSD